MAQPPTMDPLRGFRAIRVPGREDPIDRSVISPQSEMLLSVRGAFYVVPIHDRQGPGLYAIEELQRDNDTFDEVGNFAVSPASSPLLITGVKVAQGDITSQTNCLGNIKIFYTFGQNFGQVEVQGEMLLGPLGMFANLAVKRLTDFFWKNRVSVKKTPLALSVAQNQYLMYLTGMSLGAIDPEYHVLPFLLYGTLLDVNRDDAGNTNLAGTVITGGTSSTSLWQALNQTVVTPRLAAMVSETDAEEAGEAMETIDAGEEDAEPVRASIGANELQKILNNESTDMSAAQKEYKLLREGYQAERARHLRAEQERISAAKGETGDVAPFPNQVEWNVVLRAAKEKIEFEDNIRDADSTPRTDESPMYQEYLKRAEDQKGMSAPRSNPQTDPILKSPKSSTDSRVDSWVDWMDY